jgi:2-polyprenyl-6-methoxyphenol hydroxylase-like FAD-dependent oxidoreductase
MNPAHGRVAPVAIVGAGPVGLALALGLARSGIRSVLLEREPATTEQSKAAGIHVRTREAFRQWGVEDRFLEAGVLRRTLPLHDAAADRGPILSIDFSDLEQEADRPGLLVLEQGTTEALLLDAVRDSGLCDVQFGAEAVGLDARQNLVRLAVRRGDEFSELDAGYVVGCDGASSFVRDALGLPFDGLTYSLRPMLADVRVAGPRDGLPWPRIRNAAGGLTFTFRLRPGVWRVVRLDRGDPTADGEVTGDELAGEEVPAEEVAERVDEVLGPGPFEIVWASRFRIHRRASPRFRVGRVLLAGDAAHIHSPAGGLGMNAGVQDAHNLAWKLAAAHRGGDADRLLDSYDVERRAVVAQDVSRYSDFITRAVLQTPRVIRKVGFVLWRWALGIPPLRLAAVRRATMIDLDYPASPLLDPDARAAGVRLPNVAVRGPDGAEVRLYDLLGYDATLIVLGRRPDRAAPPGVGRVVHIGPGGHADPTGYLERLAGGDSGWILVRPDAHVVAAHHRRGGIEEAAGGALGAPPARSS